MIDNTLSHDTPEGIRLSLVPAGIGVRAWAFLIDLIIRHLLFGLCALCLLSFGQAGFGLLSLAYFLVVWWYPVICEMLWQGQTLGKKAFKIRTMMDNGTQIGFQASMIRHLLIIADFLPMLFFGAIVCMLFDRQFKRLGDKVAGTVVVYDYDKHKSFDIVAHTPIIPPVLLTLSEQKAILQFAERAGGLSADRVRELVAILAPLTNMHNTKQPSQVILGYANYIVGRQAVDIIPVNQSNTSQSDNISQEFTQRNTHD